MGRKRIKTGRVLQLLAAFALLTAGFNNCSPTRTSSTESTNNSSRAAFGGDVFSGKVYVHRLTDGLCADGSDVSSLISVDANKAASLHRDDCAGLAAPQSLPPSDVSISPDERELRFKGRTYTLESKIAGLLGPTLNVSQVQAKGGTFAQYEENFRTLAEVRWNTDGADTAKAGQYDRAKIFYTWWTRSGDRTYLERATALALNHRTNYIEARNYDIQPWDTNIEGVALHYTITGDPLSKLAVAKVADWYARDWNLNRIGDSTITEPVTQARTLVALLTARDIGAVRTAAPANNWDSALKAALSKILATQAANGSYPMTATCGLSFPYEVGILNDALLEYYERFERDPRILPAIKKSLDHFWATAWLPADKAFVYAPGPCESGPVPAPTLNNFLINGFGWVYSKTGDPIYKQRGDEVFAGGVTGAVMDGSRQFNQNYFNSYKYFFYRGE